MKTMLKLLAVALALLVPLTSTAAERPYNIQVAATAANTTVTFGFKPCRLLVSNDGANEAFIRWDAAAVAAATTNVQVPAYKGRSFKFRDGMGPSTMGVICSGAETATVRVEAYQCEAGEGLDVVDFPGLATAAGAITADTVTTTGAAIVGSTLAVGTNATITGTLTQTGIGTFAAAPVMSALTASRLVVTGAGKALASNPAITTNAIPKSAASGATLATSAIVEDGATVTTTLPLVSSGAYITGLKYISTPDADTIAADGAGTHAAYSLAPTAAVVLATCNDADGCTLLFSEVGAVSGEKVTVINVSANHIDIADTATVQETAGAVILGQWDSISFVYATDRWVEVSASDN